MQTFHDVPTHAAEIARRLRAGEVAAYPTEAVMGLGCDPSSEAAVTRICALKQRAVEQGVLLIASDFSQVAPYLEMAQVLRRPRSTGRWRAGPVRSPGSFRAARACRPGCRGGMRALRCA
jgi:tRNA A37 threonylcarbamoyladenosine synthetase subunit TsaC/SUA5/YrdC